MATVVIVHDDADLHFSCNAQCDTDVPYSGRHAQPAGSSTTDKQQIPLQAWLVAFTRLLYDRELAVLERNVKPASVLHNASLILGKQIIHILPEGYSVEATEELDSILTYPIAVPPF